MWIFPKASTILGTHIKWKRSLTTRKPSTCNKELARTKMSKWRQSLDFEDEMNLLCWKNVDVWHDIHSMVGKQRCKRKLLGKLSCFPGPNCHFRRFRSHGAAGGASSLSYMQNFPHSICCKTSNKWMVRKSIWYLLPTTFRRFAFSQIFPCF